MNHKQCLYPCTCKRMCVNGICSSDCELLSMLVSACGSVHHICNAACRKGVRDNFVTRSSSHGYARCMRSERLPVQPTSVYNIPAGSVAVAHGTHPRPLPRPLPLPHPVLSQQSLGWPWYRGRGGVKHRNEHVIKFR